MRIRLKDERLSKRWLYLVRSQMKVSCDLAAGAGGTTDLRSAFSATQAAWRFYNNERVKFHELVTPLQEYVKNAVVSIESPFLLIAQDWSKVSFPGHIARKDMAELSSESDIGYEMTASLAINPDNGAPLAPVELHLKTGNGLLSTKETQPALDLIHLEQVLPSMQAAANMNLGKPLVHVIDREVDSLMHYRQWDQAGFKYLIRADDRRVTWESQEMKMSAIRSLVTAQSEYQVVRPILYHGRSAQLEVAEVAVILTRPGRTRVDNKRVLIPGPPLPLRLILTRVVDKAGNVLAHWYLLSNVPVEWASAAQLAQSYYWRWRIESYFKLLKSHGFQLESWLQETGEAILRRILVVSMAAVTVWHLLADESPCATEFKQFLVRISNRQTKRTRPFTAPALLAGICALLTTMAILEKYDVYSLAMLVGRVNLPIPLLNLP